MQYENEALINIFQAVLSRDACLEFIISKYDFIETKKAKTMFNQYLREAQHIVGSATHYANKFSLPHFIYTYLEQTRYACKHLDSDLRSFEIYV